MVAQELLHQQRELAPKEDLILYAGQWVAMRDGHVIGSAPTFDELATRGVLRDEDALLRVPDQPDAFKY